MGGGKAVLFLLTTICLLAADLSNASPAQKALHQALRRSVVAAPRIDPASCIDNSQCASSTICTDDPDLGAALCPIKCGVCVCEDNLATQGNCSSLTPSICEGDFGPTLCPKTCGLCGSGVGSCFDHVTGIDCADLPDPCKDELGKVACPKFCGLCVDDTTTKATAAPTSADPCANNPCLNNGVCSLSGNTFGFVCNCLAPYSGTICEQKPATTAPPAGVCVNNPCLNNGACVLASNTFGFECNCPAPYSGTICEKKPDPTTTTQQPATTGSGSQTTQSSSTGSCPNMLKDQNSLPCQEGEIVFMIEYGYKDTSNSIDHEGDFVKELVDAWRIKDSNIRFGVVIYHDTVSEAIHITDYKDDPEALKDRITRLTRAMRPSGSADLGKALDYVRETSFKNARPGAVKVVIPIIHQMSRSTKDKILPAAQRLKDDCVSIVGVAVGDDSLDYDIIHNSVSQPYNSFYSYHRSYNDMENSAKWVHYYYPGCHNRQLSANGDATATGNVTVATTTDATTHHHHHQNHLNNVYNGDGE